MKPASTAGSDRRRRWPSVDVACALAIGLLALALYVATLQPDLGGPEDTPKFQFLGYVLGTAHPPGYPLYVMLSHLFVKLPIGTIAYRANLFSAVMAAFACALAYLISRQLGTGRWPALCAAGGLATGYCFWTSAVFAEVYSLAAVVAALTISLLLAWGARGGATRLIASVAVFGLGLGNHLTIVGLLPAAMCYVLVRDRRSLTGRVVAAAAAVLLIGVSQYAFIVVRTYQGAPYLESGAKSLGELVGVMTAERFADDRFAFSLSTLLTVQVPETATVIGRELGVGGVLLLGAGLVAAAYGRSLGAALVVSAAAGMFAMVVNLRGDTNGFITPVVTLLWPVAGYGLDAAGRLLRSFRLILGIDIVGRAVPSLRGVSLHVGTMLLAGALVIPVTNLLANYALVDQSRQTGHAQFFRTMFAQLPQRAAVVAEDYFVESSLQYLMFTSAAGSDKEIARVGFGAGAARDARRDGRRVFALTTGATFLAAEGLAFNATTLLGPQLDAWLEHLPKGTVVVGAAATAAVPLEFFGRQRRQSRVARSTRPFSAFALVAGRPEIELREDDAAAAMDVDTRLLNVPLPRLPGRLVASADKRNARIELDGRTIAEADFGVAVAVFGPDGALVQVFELPAGGPARPPLARSIYELEGDAPCVEVRTDTWSDISPVLATGSVLTTVSGFGAVGLQIELDEPETRARGVELLGAGVIRTTGPTRGPEGSQVLIVDLSRHRSRRPVFRLAIDSPSHSGRARVRPGGVQSSITLCAHVPGPLFRSQHNPGIVKPDFDGEAYFGAGWGGPEATATGSVRRGGSGATLLLPLESTTGYRAVFDVVGEPATTIEIMLNTTAIGTCNLSERGRCEAMLPAGMVRPGINTLTFSVPAALVANVEPVDLTFRGARIWRLTSP
jgi:hypothetical protein